MSPFRRALLLLLLDALQSGVIGAAGVLLVATEFTSYTLLIAGVTFLAQFATNVKAGLQDPTLLHGETAAGPKPPP
jgi:hypothetical protein